VKSKRIAILESRLGEQLVSLVSQRGGVPFHAPALAELPDLEPQKIAELMRALEQRPPKLFVFQTGVGTRALFAALDGLKQTQLFLRLLDQAIVVVRGPKPTGALRARGVRIDSSAADPFTTNEVLESIRDIPLEKERVIVQRYGVANAELDRALEARGAQVTEIPTYRWSLPADTQPLEKLIGALERNEMHAAVFTNAEQVRNLFAVARKLDKAAVLQQALNRTLVASIGSFNTAALLVMRVEIIEEC